MGLFYLGVVLFVYFFIFTHLSNVSEVRFCLPYENSIQLLCNRRGNCSKETIYRQTCDLQMLLGKWSLLLTWPKSTLTSTGKVIFFHNIYKTSCPRHELTFGVNTRLWQSTLREELLQPRMCFRSNWPDLHSDIPNLLSPPGIASVGTKMLPQPQPSGTRCGGHNQGRAVSGARTLHTQPRGAAGLPWTLWVHTASGSCGGIISHLWKHNVISVVKTQGWVWFCFFFF